jgi:hypothetical protein
MLLITTGTTAKVGFGGDDTTAGKTANAISGNAREIGIPEDTPPRFTAATAQPGAAREAID